MDDRRHKILLAAERLVTHYGIAKTTISDIAREARIGVGTVYLEFTSKDEIVGNLAKDRHTRVLDAMQTAAHADLAYAERFRAMMDDRVRAFVAFADDGIHASDLIHCGCEAVQAEFEQFKAAQVRILADLLEQARAAGAFHHEDSMATARSVLRAYSTFTPPALYHQTFQDLFGELAAMHDLMLGGLLRR